MNLQETLEKIQPLDERMMEVTRKRWDSIAHPLHSLGLFEDVLVEIAGMTRSQDMDYKKKALVTMCADNGVVEEGVTQTGQEVTAIVAENFLVEQATASILCRECGADIYPVDIGMVTDTKVPRHKVAYGTKNMAKEPAMTREEAVEALEVGIHMAEELVARGYRMLATGEMGIGNTTTSSAVASVLLEEPVEKMTGRGAGLSSEGLEKKIHTIKKAIALHQPDKKDAIDVLSKVGGLDIAGMAGVCLGAAALQVPVVIDGFISGVAALVAARICPAASGYIIASHVSKEPAAQLILEAMDKRAFLHADMHLGEGTGAVTLFPLLDMAAAIYNSMSTFQEINVEEYQHLK
ncbi:MAG: nicotinate-nucleotide--dimethylbenzimidazole phosphoribosyltransferase [Blautia sp.]